MINLKIEQNESVAENATDSLINKLYSVVSGITKPQLEDDNAQISGYLSTPHAYKEYVEYLANTVGEGTSGIVTTLRLNVGGRFPNLRIDVTNDYYILFLDSNIKAALIAALYGDGIGITYVDAAEIPLESSFFSGNSSITRFNEFKYFTKVNKSTLNNYSLNSLFFNATNLSEIDLSELEVIHLREFLNTAITTVNAPKLSTMSSYGSSAFSYCANLVTVLNLGTIPNISVGMFEGCSNLLSVVVPETCTEIKRDAFKSCGNLTTLLVLNPSNITFIGQSAFHGCNKLELDLSNFNNVTKIESTAFANCYEVTGVINMPNYSFDTFQLGITKVSKILCAGTASKTQDLWARNTTDASLTEVYLPYECTNIGVNSFANLTNLSIIKQYDKTISEYLEGETKTYMADLSKITHFGKNAFKGCNHISLTGNDLVNAIKIENSAFLDSSLSGILNLLNLTELQPDAFHNSNITSVISLGNVTDLPYSAFWGCSSLTSIPLSSVTTIGPNCFRDCTSLSTIGTNTFNFTKLEKGIFCATNLLGELNFPNATEMDSGDYGLLFLNCVGLTKITLGHITSMKGGNRYYSETRGHFTGCTSLKIVDLGDSIEEITCRGFWNCTALKAVIIRNTTPPYLNTLGGSTDISEFFAGADIYVPDAAVTAYKEASVFSGFDPTRIKSLNNYNESAIMNS